MRIETMDLVGNFDFRAVGISTVPPRLGSLDGT